jgi:hypothetical protein
MKETGKLMDVIHTHVGCNGLKLGWTNGFNVTWVKRQSRTARKETKIEGRKQRSKRKEEKEDGRKKCKAVNSRKVEEENVRRYKMRQFQVKYQK